MLKQDRQTSLPLASASASTRSSTLSAPSTFSSSPSVHHRNVSGSRDCNALLVNGCLPQDAFARCYSSTSRNAFAASPSPCSSSSSSSSHSPYGPQKGDRITIALSGGVDSSVTAALLAYSDQDYDLSAVFMRNWNELDERDGFEPGSGGASGCSWQKDWEDVQSVCRHLGNIPVTMVDLSKEYWTQVFEPALDDWKEGTTPNPDVNCNREIKFGALMDRVLSLPHEHEREESSSSSGSRRGRKKSWLATGHYANIVWSETGRPMLHRARDRTKDQTYYLSSVTESRLAHAHFPLANLLKSEVRQLAKQLDLPTANRRESMGICFIGTRTSDSSKSISNTQGFSSFLNGYLPSIPGNIVDAETLHIVGQHNGLHTLTVGQGARISGALSKYYVAKKNIAQNEIVVVQGKDHSMLLCTRLYVSKIDWIWNQPPQALALSQTEEEGKGLGEKGGVKLLAQVRHRQMETDCIVTKKSKTKSGEVEEQGEDEGYVVEFPEPVLAVAPGQVLGLWKGDWCLGSGVIQSVDTLYDDRTRQIHSNPHNP